MGRMKRVKKDVETELLRFGLNLKKLRGDRNLTQEQLAEKAELATRVLQKIEAGQTNILITTAHRLQKSLKCRWDDLMSL